MKFKLSYNNISQINKYFSLTTDVSILQVRLENNMIKLTNNENGILLFLQITLDTQQEAHPPLDFSLSYTLIKQLNSLKKDYYQFEVADNLLKIYFDNNVINLSLLYGTSLDTIINLDSLDNNLATPLQDNLDLFNKLSLITGLPKDYNYYNNITFGNNKIYGEIFGNYFNINVNLNINTQLYYMFIPYILNILPFENLRYLQENDKFIIYNDYAYLELPTYNQNIQPSQDFSIFKELSSFNLNKQVLLDNLSTLSLVPTNYSTLQLHKKDNTLYLQINDLSNIPSIFTLDLQDCQDTQPSIKFSISLSTLQKIVSLLDNTLHFSILSGEDGTTPFLLKIMNGEDTLYLSLMIND